MQHMDAFTNIDIKFFKNLEENPNMVTKYKVEIIFCESCDMIYIIKIYLEEIQ